jgi:hypothetical protein
MCDDPQKASRGGWSFINDQERSEEQSGEQSAEQSAEQSKEQSADLSDPVFKAKDLNEVGIVVYKRCYC